MSSSKSFSEVDVARLRREYAAERKQRIDLEAEIERLKASNENLAARCNTLASEKSGLEQQIVSLRSDLIDPIVELERVRRLGPASYETQLWTKLFVKLVEITGRGRKTETPKIDGIVPTAVEVKK